MRKRNKTTRLRISSAWNKARIVLNSEVAPRKGKSQPLPERGWWYCEKIRLAHWSTIRDPRTRDFCTKLRSTSCYCFRSLTKTLTGIRMPGGGVPREHRGRAQQGGQQAPLADHVPLAWEHRTNTKQYKVFTFTNLALKVIFITMNSQYSFAFGECFCKTFVTKQIKLIAALSWKQKGYTDVNKNSSKIYSKCKHIIQNVLVRGTRVLWLKHF